MISRITDKVIEEMNDWAMRPLDEIYAAVFVDAIVVKVRDGQVANRPFYAAIGVTLDGERDILGLIIKDASWLFVLGYGAFAVTSLDRRPPQTGCLGIDDVPAEVGCSANFGRHAQHAQHGRLQGVA
ncbi:MAG: transposase mutator type [Pseudonocardiales bacterium]|nr:transposase mutator type [Pseudonocardiales bacterium]